MTRTSESAIEHDHWRTYFDALEALARAVRSRDEDHICATEAAIDRIVEDWEAAST